MYIHFLDFTVWKWEKILCLVTFVKLPSLIDNTQPGNEPVAKQDSGEWFPFNLLLKARATPIYTAEDNNGSETLIIFLKVPFELLFLFFFKVTIIIT